MSAAALPESLSEREAWGERSRLIQRAYTVSLSAAFFGYTLVFGWKSGAAFALLCVLVLAALIASLLLPSAKAARRLAGWSAGLAGILALAMPLGVQVASGQSLPQAVHAVPVWPSLLVLLFASRLRSAMGEARFAAFWRDPLNAEARGSVQSLGAAVLLGAALTILFYQLAGLSAVAPDRVDPAAILLRAFAGQTIIHASIVLLFFTVVAMIADAALMTWRESVALAALRRLWRGAQPRSRDALARLAASQLAQVQHTRMMQFVLARDETAGRRGRTLEDFHAASRRLMRALLSFLPLLGFLGTVIGLTAAIGGLPGDLGPGAGANLDISASLLGLAVKFETTLLGLLGALIGALLLALLEKREAELAAACRRLLDAADG